MVQNRMFLAGQSHRAHIHIYQYIHKQTQNKNNLHYVPSREEGGRIGRWCSHRQALPRHRAIASLPKRCIYTYMYIYQCAVYIVRTRLWQSQSTCTYIGVQNGEYLRTLVCAVGSPHLLMFAHSSFICKLTTALIEFLELFSNYH